MLYILYLPSSTIYTYFDLSLTFWLFSGGWHDQHWTDWNNKWYTEFGRLESLVFIIDVKIRQLYKWWVLWSEPMILCEFWINFSILCKICVKLSKISGNRYFNVCFDDIKLFFFLHYSCLMVDIFSLSLRIEYCGISNNINGSKDYWSTC